jgi:integrase
MANTTPRYTVSNLRQATALSDKAKDDPRVDADEVEKALIVFRDSGQRTEETKRRIQAMICHIPGPTWRRSMRSFGSNEQDDTAKASATASPKRRRISHNNSVVSNPPSKQKPKMMFLTEDEVARLFAAIDTPRDTAIFRIAYHRGLRASEIGNLQLADYDARGRRLTVKRLKRSRGGTYSLTDNESRALNAWLKVRGSEPGPLFTSNRGTGIKRGMLDVLMKRYGVAAKLPADKRHMHALKHSCATHLLSTHRLDVAVVQDHLGHANIQNTMRYARITNARREEVADKLRKW